MPPRVILAGLFHETHTFLEGTTGVSDFQFRYGTELLTAKGDGSPLAGTIETADKLEWELVPIVDARATPGPIVLDEVLHKFWNDFAPPATEALARGVDGILLILHGAMATQSFPDVEGEILERLRKLPGADKIPFAAILDLHANVSQRMTENVDAIAAYRENPHSDAHATAVRGAEVLGRLIWERKRCRVVRQGTTLVWPPTGTGTSADPMQTLERMARDIERRKSDILEVCVLGGFAFADTYDTGVCFCASTIGDVEEAKKELTTLNNWAFEHRTLGNAVEPPLEEVLQAVRQKLRANMKQSEAKESAARPIILVEPSDNIGGGGPGDCTSLLRGLIQAGIHDAAVVINDPLTAQALHRLPLGSVSRVDLGGRGSRLDPGPLSLEVELVSVSDGRFDLEDRQSHLASMCGVHVEMGPCAVVRHGGILILITSRKTPPFDLGQLRSQGIIPEKQRLIGVKAAVANRRAYDPIAGEMLWVDTPGPCSSNLKRFPFEKIRRPIYPLDQK